MLLVAPHHVIFDCDGVLVDTVGHVFACLAEALTEAGLALDGAAARRRFAARPLAAVMAEAEAELGRPLPEGWAERLREETLIRVKFRSRPIAHAGETLRMLSARNVRLSVVSPAPPERITVALGVAGLLKFLTPRLYSASMFDRDVHIPDLFAHAMRVAGIVPQRTAAIVDSVAAAEAARAAGATALGFTADPAVDAEGLAAAGAIVFKDMRKLAGQLRLA